MGWYRIWFQIANHSSIYHELVTNRWLQCIHSKYSELHAWLSSHEPNQEKSFWQKWFVENSEARDNII